MIIRFLEPWTTRKIICEDTLLTDLSSPGPLTQSPYYYSYVSSSTFLAFGYFHPWIELFREQLQCYALEMLLAYQSQRMNVTYAENVKIRL